jgi:hypothetical protein
MFDFKYKSHFENFKTLPHQFLFEFEVDSIKDGQ